MTARRVHAIFPDGAMLSAATWSALEDTIRDDAWNDAPTLGEFRALMAQRAAVWSGTSITEGDEVSSRRFLQRLEAAGILRLETDEGEES